MYQRTSTSANRPEKWTAGIDWFRYKVTDLRAARHVHSLIQEIQTQDLKRASDLKPWRFQGYVGKASDSIRYGIKGLDLLWETSGDRAASIVDFMGPSGGSALRIDLQVTLRFSSARPDLGTYLLGYSQTRKTTSRRRQIRLGLSTATSGLWLGTVGQRTSPRYMRLYDKGVESKMAPPGILWRLELEAKHSLAAKLCLDHLTSLTDPKFCANYVGYSAKHLGLRWPYSLPGESEPDIRLGKNESTTAGRLAVWLSTTVAPTLPRLLSVFTVAEVLEMLKLSDVASPKGNSCADTCPIAHARSERPPMARHVSVRDARERRLV